MIDELRAMAIFVETIEQGSFRKAANTLGLSASVVSHHVSSLEKKLGCALIYRSTRHLSLTEDGQLLFEHARQMLMHARLGLSEVTPNLNAPHGKLTISIPALFARSKFAEYLAEFIEAYPNIKLNIHSSDERQNIIGQGIDIAVRLGGMNDSSLKAIPIGTIERRAVCSVKFAEQQGKVSHPKALAKWPWISLAMLNDARTFVKYDKKNKKIIASYETEFQPIHVVNSVEYLYALCKLGVGVATPPLFMTLASISAGQMSVLLPEWHVTPINIYLVWPPNSPQTSITRLFIDFLKQKPMNL